MPKLARVPANDGPPETASAARSNRAARPRGRYYAFLSYSHQDEELADWLHQELEEFRVPQTLAGRLTANGVVPKRLTPIFRDEHELAAADDLGEEIREALASSQYLIVLCSPAAAKSHWTNAEIETFKRTRPDGCVLAAIASGEPFASEIPGREGEECFPPALRQKFDRRGRPTGKRAEPLAADLRDEEDRRLGVLKLVAGMLGVGLDDLVQRDTTRRHRRLAWLAAASLGGMAVTSTLAIAAIQARDEAREQRREAEGLVAFMLGDLKDKLDPIGRLDALDGVGSRVLAYYSKQDASELTDAAISQRSQALTLMAQVANARGDSQTALNLYRQAMAGTAEAMRRDPSNAEAIFEHAQNVFYVGDIAEKAEDYRTAEESMRSYQRLARQMVTLEPDNLKYRMEGQYAAFNLGVVLYDQRRFTEAVAQFKDALSTMEAIAQADPNKKEYQQGVAEALTWLADAERSTGDYDQAIAARQRTVASYAKLYGKWPDVKFRERLSSAQRWLAYYYGERGQPDLAKQQYQAAIASADSLTAVEPNNANWLSLGATARVALAKLLLVTGHYGDAATEATTGCRTFEALLRRPSRRPEWLRGPYACAMIRADLAMTSGGKDEALAAAREAVTAAMQVHSSDKVEDAFRLVRAYRLVGDVQRARGDLNAAQAAWSKGLEVMPKGVAERPDEMQDHATLLQRLGRRGEAQPLMDRLRATGYRLAI